MKRSTAAVGLQDGPLRERPLTRTGRGRVNDVNPNKSGHLGYVHFSPEAF
jgi:hypothetical protein